MTLPVPEVDQFYSIWLPMLHFANEKLNIVPSLSGGAKDHIDIEHAIKIRDALWKNQKVLDEFIAENPAHLPDDSLRIAETWKYRLHGTFMIYKVFKKHTIFISQEEEETPNVFAVVGLYSSFDEMFGPYLPIVTVTTLLPFKEVIIADGLFETYNVILGPGIKRSLKESHEDAKERGAILTSLIPGANQLSPEERLKIAVTTNKKILEAFQKYQYEASYSSKTVDRDLSRVSSFAQYLISTAPRPASLREIKPAVVFDYLNTLNVKDQKSASMSLKRFIAFLQYTRRINWDEAEMMIGGL